MFTIVVQFLVILEIESINDILWLIKLLVMEKRKEEEKKPEKNDCYNCDLLNSFTFNFVTI